MELGAVGEGKRRKLQSSQEIKKGQKRGVNMARDQRGGYVREENGRSWRMQQ